MGSETGGFARFPTTRMSALQGLRADDEEQRGRSWDAIVEAYWRPAYKHVRVKWRKERADAEDITQAFFTQTVERDGDVFAGYDPDKGRFRTFVRVCLDRFVSNLNKSDGRQKRGGGAPMLDFEQAESELAQSGGQSPDEVFDREYERAIFQSAIERLRAESLANGKESHFTIFERYDLADEHERPASYEELGRELGLPATTITNRLAYARRELKRLVTEAFDALG